MLLDDNLDILQMVEEVLTYERFDVKAAMQSAHRLQLAEQFRPDLIILDYRLADGNGGDLCREIKAHPSLNHIPVVIFSAYLHPDLDFRSFGCDVSLLSPLTWT